MLGDDGKNGWNPFSLVSKVSFSILILTVCAIIEMLFSAWVINSIQGNAHAINRIGYMRMQSYELLSLVPVDNQNNSVFVAVDDNSHSYFITNYIQGSDIAGEYHDVHQFWLKTVKPTLLNAKTPEQARKVVVQYVSMLDNVVHLIDKKTENKLLLLKTLQKCFIVFLILLLFLTVSYLRNRIFFPWRKLLKMTFELKKGNFKARYPVNNKKDEMNQLGLVLNSMADEIEVTYKHLETLVEKKTQRLMHKNEILDFLYRMTEHLITNRSERYCTLLFPVIHELKNITGFKNITIDVFDIHNSSMKQVISTDQIQRPENCFDSQCQCCISNKVITIDDSSIKKIKWKLDDGQRCYGALIISVPISYTINKADIQLVETISKQITRTLFSKYQEYLNAELMLAEERSTIARELHDSIAQSLSCTKIRLSCLQMQSDCFSEEQRILLKDMRKETDTAYAQLRHLLSTFRLKTDEEGLLQTLEKTIEEFNYKLSLVIDFSFDIPANCISSHQSVHIIHIIREALSNIYKHAAAKIVIIEAKYEAQEQKIIISIFDNGCGMDNIHEPKNHYGFSIMRNRAKSLSGVLDIESKKGHGTKIIVTLKPQ